MLTELAYGLLIQFIDVESWLPGPIGPLTPRMTRAHHLPGHEAAGNISSKSSRFKAFNVAKAAIGWFISIRAEAIGGANFARFHRARQTLNPNHCGFRITLMQQCFSQQQTASEAPPSRTLQLVHQASR